MIIFTVIGIAVVILLAVVGFETILDRMSK
jgi:hypothetical protein